MNTAARTTIRPPMNTRAPGESGMFPAVRPRRPSSPPAGKLPKHAGYKHVGFRLTEEHAELLQRAADVKTGGDLAAYLRPLALEYAAADTGEPTPDLRQYDYRNVVAEAARAKGMSVAQFEAWSARELALQIVPR